MKYKALKKDTLHLEIVDQITEMYLSGELKVGDKLPAESELVKKFGVSRTVIREAKKALASRGIISITPGRGTIVESPPLQIVTDSLHLFLSQNAHFTKHLIAARLILEVPISRLAAKNASEENIQKLAEQIEGMKRTIYDPSRFVSYDSAFHEELALATQNPVLNILVQPIAAALQLSREILVKEPSKSIRALRAHEKIFDFVRCRDVEKAGAAMRDHLIEVANDFPDQAEEKPLTVDDVIALYEQPK